MKNLIILTIINLLIAPLACVAQIATPISDKDFAVEMDAFVGKTMTAFPELPSIAMVVVKDNKPIFIRAYGLANKETGTKADANTLYYIASATKSYTALAAAMVDREGKIRLGDPITKYAKGVTFKTPIPDKVTIRDLLTHTSALDNDPFAWRVAYSGDADEKQLVDILANGTSFDDKTYGKYAYTNLGYNIYGELAWLTLGKRWQDLLQEKVFDPIGMKQTTAYVSRARTKKLSVADSYLFDPSTESVIRAPLDKMDSNMQAAGGIYTSLNDLSRWLIVNINNGKIDGRQVIPADVMQTVHTGYADVQRSNPPFTGSGKYGLGWQIGQYKNEQVIYHFGGFPGWTSHISYMPDKKIGVAVIVNESTAGGQVESLLATYAYDRLLGKETNEAYEKRLGDMAGEYGRFKQQMVGSFKSRASRTWQLTRPVADYTGTYTNDLMGDINISVENGVLAVRKGNIHIASTPFTEKDTIRVEMVPGSGEVIKFNMTDSGPDALMYGDMKFVKAKGN